MDKYMKLTNENLLHTYQRFPITLDHGKGVYLYDADGKKYLDFMAGIAVSGLGYGNEELNNALKNQMDCLLHSSNLYYNTTCGKAAGLLRSASGMDRIFFTNSGAEANEGALKAARKYAWQKKSGRFELIAMKGSFHGRTMGALSVTEHAAYRAPFEPLISGVSFAEFNNLESVKELVNDRTCGIIVEPIQGEGGIHVATQEFMRGIRKLCDEQGILMICDEIQCGMARTGEMFAWQMYGTKPDIMTMAKAIGSGIPVGAFAMTEKVAEASLTVGDHGTTYGGNPLACAAVAKTLEIYEQRKMPSHVREIGDYLGEQLEKLVKEYDCVLEQRGVGLIRGIKLKGEVGEIVKRAMEEGLLIISARDNVIRLVPPLVIEKDHVDEMIDKLRKVL